MRKTWIFTVITLFCIGIANAAGRDEIIINRAATTNNTSPSRSVPTNQTNDARAAAVTRSATTSASREISTRNTGPTVTRAATVTRPATTVARSATATPATSVRSATKPTRVVSAARATTVKPATETFGTGYNECRDTYFTCMDQFCAHANDTYRRCVCSSRLAEIKSKERALSQTSEQLQDFQDMNIDSINKTGAEVKAMLTATAGEKTSKNDTSSAAGKLAGISAVLSKTKSQSLSTAGRLDIAGDINSIWSTTDLAGGADIINLTGESLYNAVHAQCAEFAAANCNSKATLNMVVSAYGMYIENDCTALSNSLAKKTTAASGAIRQTEFDMNAARLENYNAHNSTSINDCIAQVRKDITSDNACGKDYVHCLDISHQYLNFTTGEPIYSPNFYQLELMTSLSGDVLTNQTNRMLVAELNGKKQFAARGLSTCTDLATGVWEEFMRQAIAEIYQGQQTRIRQVKTECIDVVNNCYDTKSKSLKDFSNIKEQLLIGARLELSEEMCKSKLDACSNLYGGGTLGLNELVSTMKNITDQTIAKDCHTTLQEYITEICAVPQNDIVHAYPFACRIYAPGDQKYATLPQCAAAFATIENNDQTPKGTVPTIKPEPAYHCTGMIEYIGCDPGYALGNKNSHYFNGTVGPDNICLLCPEGFGCAGGIAMPYRTTVAEPGECDDYPGSLYQKLVRYAKNTCVRPTESGNDLPESIMGDINRIMDNVKIEMGKELSKECERLGGVWTYKPIPDNTDNDIKFVKQFYTDTSSNKKWGYCTEKPTTPETPVAETP